MRDTQPDLSLSLNKSLKGKALTGLFALRRMCEKWCYT